MFDVELLNYDPETSSFYVMMITVLLAFFLSSIIAITYHFTTKDIHKKAHFLQSIALIGIVAATVMQAIGDSVAVGLGMLGALAIIRFRTVLDDPRNITFMFASLASGIACGVLGYAIAITGTLALCAGAIILRFSPFNISSEMIGEIRLQVRKDASLQNFIEQKLSLHCRNYELDRLRFLTPTKETIVNEKGIPVVKEMNRDDLQEFTYMIKLRNSATITSLEQSLKEIDGLKDFRINIRKQPPKL